MKGYPLLVAGLLSLEASAVVSFKDADKIKSWDAWGDHKAQVAWPEIVRPCAGGFRCGRVAGPPVALKTCK